MRFHVVALPHTQTTPAHQTCAYTQKVRNFCRMMHSLGHEVFHYGAEGSDVADFAEHVEIISRADQEICFGRREPNQHYNVDWEGKAAYWRVTNERAAAAINSRKQPRDFLCLIAGHLHKPIADLTGLMAVEYGVGYFGTFSQYRVFESYSHMHHVWGRQSNGRDVDGRNYDAVIPNYFDPADFPFLAEKQDYFLFIGRMIRRKGIQIAVDACQAIGARLILAGQGARQQDDTITTDDGQTFRGDNLQYVGAVMGEEEEKLFQNARAVFVPTIYVEPFGGVAVEAQLAGTPAITSDWGAFSETVEHGRSGYRCRTLDQFVWAAQHAGDLDPQYIHDRAVANYSLDRVRHQYQEYFDMLADLWGDGWNTLRPEREQLDWLKRF